MELESISQCPICKSVSFQNYLTCKDYTTTQEKFSLIKCTNCSFLITSPRPSSEHIGKYYQSDKYISHTGGSENLIDKIYLLARSYSLNRKRKLLEKFSTKGMLLDYGSGTGHFITHCSKNGWVCEGVEPSASAREKGIKLSQLPIYQSIKSIKEKKYQVISLWHVMEHIHNLTDTLSDLTKMLADEGVIFIAVPNHESYDAQKYKEQWAAYDVPRHLWHFNKENISTLLKQNGLTLVQIIPMKLDAFYVSLLSESYKNPESRKLIQFIKAFWNGWVSNLKAANKKNHSSLIYIARK